MHEWIAGRNPVYEVLRAKKRQVFRLIAASGMQPSERLQEIFKLSKDRRIPIENVPRHTLDRIDEHHQGIAIETSPYQYHDLLDILESIDRAAKPALVLILDMIQNPQNLGTLLRSAEALGVDGVIIPLARTAGVTPAVVHASSGASEHLLIAQENLAQAISSLKEAGVWIFGLESGENSQSIEKVDLSIPLAWVVGNEGDGLRALVKKSCDMLVSLPMLGQVDSFNAAVAGSLALFETVLARRRQIDWGSDTNI